MSSLSPDPSPDPASASSRSTWYPFNDGGAFDSRFATILIVVLALVVVALAIVTIVRSFHVSAAVPSPPPAPARKHVPVPPAMDFSAGMQLAGAEVECAICLSEFVSGEKVTVLPRCNHMFHASCIERWLGSCPICRTILQSPPPPPEKNLSLSELSPV